MARRAAAQVGGKTAQLLFPAGTPTAFAALSRACMSHDPRSRPPFSEVDAVLEGFRAQLEGGGALAEL